MLKDILVKLVTELKDHEYVYEIIDPILYRIKTTFYIVVILLVLLVINMFYSNLLLYDLLKKVGNSLKSQ